MDFAETFADMVLFLVAYHVIGIVTDFVVARTLHRAYEEPDAQAADALERIADTLELLEERILIGGKDD